MDGKGKIIMDFVQERGLNCSTPCPLEGEQFLKIADVEDFVEIPANTDNQQVMQGLQIS